MMYVQSRVLHIRAVIWETVVEFDNHRANGSARPNEKARQSGTSIIREMANDLSAGRVIPLLVLKLNPPKDEVLQQCDLRAWVLCANL